MAKILARKDVPEEQKWNSKAVFESWDEWRGEAAAITASGSVWQDPGIWKERP